MAKQTFKCKTFAARNYWCNTFDGGDEGRVAGPYELAAKQSSLPGATSRGVFLLGVGQQQRYLPGAQARQVNPE